MHALESVVASTGCCNLCVVMYGFDIGFGVRADIQLGGCHTAGRLHNVVCLDRPLRLGNVDHLDNTISKRFGNVDHLISRIADGPDAR